MNLGATNAQSVYFGLRMGIQPCTGTGTITAGITTGEGVQFSSFSTIVVGLQTVDALDTAAVDTTVAQTLALTVINFVANASYDTKTSQRVRRGRLIRLARS